MYFCRVVFGGASLFVLLLILTLGTGGCSEKKAPRFTSKKIDCVTKITVDPTSGVDTHQKAAYVCSGDTVKWDAHRGVTFTVHFPPAPVRSILVRTLLTPSRLRLLRRNRTTSPSISTR